MFAKDWMTIFQFDSSSPDLLLSVKWHMVILKTKTFVMKTVFNFVYSTKILERKPQSYILKRISLQNYIKRFTWVNSKYIQQLKPIQKKVYFRKSLKPMEIAEIILLLTMAMRPQLENYVVSVVTFT